MSSAREALSSWQQHLLYPAGDVFLHVADDGSVPDGYPERFGPFHDSRFGEPSFSRQERHGVGASLNAGFAEAFKRSPFALYFVDDWALTGDLDLTAWVRILLEDESIGMVRLGPPHPDLTGRVKHTPIGWYLRLDRHHYAFAHRPALYHERFLTAYGAFEEDVNAYDCERIYAERFCKTAGPDIVYALPYPWSHVGTVELAGVQPSGGGP